MGAGSKAVGWLIFGSIIGTGAYLDLANNDNAPEIGTENSVQEVVDRYETRLTALENLSAEYRTTYNDYLQNMGDVTKTTAESDALLGKLRIEGEKFLSDAVTDRQLSEADVVSLADQFTRNVLSGKELGDYNLQNLGYLDEARADKEKATGTLRAVDNSTSDLRAEQVNDGPWMGILLALLFNEFLFVPGMKGAAKIAENRKRRGPAPKNPKNNTPSQSLTARAWRKLRGKKTFNH